MILPIGLRRSNPLTESSPDSGSRTMSIPANTVRIILGDALVRIYHRSQHSEKQWCIAVGCVPPAPLHSGIQNTPPPAIPFAFWDTYPPPLWTEWHTRLETSPFRIIVQVFSTFLVKQMFVRWIWWLFQYILTTKNSLATIVNWWLPRCNCNGVFTLPDTNTDTHTKTDKLQQYLMALLSRCSANTSTQFHTTYCFIGVCVRVGVGQCECTTNKNVFQQDAYWLCMDRIPILMGGLPLSQKCENPPLKNRRPPKKNGRPLMWKMGDPLDTHTQTHHSLDTSPPPWTHTHPGHPHVDRMNDTRLWKQYFPLYFECGR